MPRRASRASSGLPTMVSTMASGTAPIAARSLTLVRTAATPAPYGSEATKAGSRASPHAMTWSASRPAGGSAGRGGHHGAVVARAVHPAPGAQDLTDQPDLVLRPQRRMRSQEPGQLLELGRVVRAGAHGCPSRFVGQAGPAVALCRKVNDTCSIGNVITPTFLSLPERSTKPRTVGLTHVLDKGLTVESARSVLAAAAPHMDVWKFGWGTAYLDVGLPEKLELLQGSRGPLLPGWDAPGDLLGPGQGAGLSGLGGRGGIRQRRGLPRGRTHDVWLTSTTCCVSPHRRFVVLSEVGSKDPERGPHRRAVDPRSGGGPRRRRPLGHHRRSGERDRRDLPGGRLDPGRGRGRRGPRRWGRQDPVRGAPQGPAGLADPRVRPRRQPRQHRRSRRWWRSRRCAWGCAPTPATSPGNGSPRDRAGRGPRGATSCQAPIAAWP